MTFEITLDHSIRLILSGATLNRVVMHVNRMFPGRAVTAVREVCLAAAA